MLNTEEVSSNKFYDEVIYVLNTVKLLPSTLASYTDKIFY